jgi:oxygen-dependent protoporphyrinogen oxidase
MVGGARASEEALAPEERLYRVAMEELRAVLGLRAEPVFFRLFRHHRAIPQYVLGHAQRLRRLQEALRAHPGLHLHGNAYRGVGLNDCVEASYALAQAFQA